MRGSLCVTLLALAHCFSHVKAIQLQQLGEEDERIQGEYVIGFESRSQFEDFRAHQDLAANLHFADDEKRVMIAYGQLTEAELTQAQSLQGVKYIHPNMRYSVSSQPGEDPNPASWGLDRIDQRDLPLDDLYQWQLDGSGVSVIVIDTGIATDHPDFAPGQARFVADCTGSSGCQTTTNTGDPQGHGTHVAGTVGSQTYGVARGAEILNIRVLNSRGTATTAEVVNGMLYAITYVQQNPGRKYVVNMSLGGPSNPSIDDAAVDIWEAGITLVAAAGNENEPACNSSPAGAAHGITVAASSITDSHASFSNYGSCVDIYGPGVDITSLNNNWQSTLTRTISGTSMASPHVAGVAALLLSGGRDLSPDDVQAQLESTSTVGAIVGAPTGTANRLVYTLDFRPTTWVPPQSTAPPAPTPRPPLPITGCDALQDQIGHQDGPYGFRSHWNVSDVGDCCDLCLGAWECRGFTYADQFEEDGTSGTRCFLYRTRVNSTNACPYCVSGSYQSSERVTPTPTDVPTVAPTTSPPTVAPTPVPPTVAPTTSPPSPVPTPAPPLPELFCGSYVVDSTVGKPNLAGYPAGDIVYRWHFPEGGAYTIDTCTTTTTYDSYLRLYADEALTTPLRNNDDGCSNPGLASIISGSRAAGVYYIVVDGFSSNEGTFGLSVTCGAPTTPSTSTTTTVTTNVATTAPGVPVPSQPPVPAPATNYCGLVTEPLDSASCIEIVDTNRGLAGFQLDAATGGYLHYNNLTFDDDNFGAGQNSPINVCMLALFGNQPAFIPYTPTYDSFYESGSVQAVHWFGQCLSGECARCTNNRIFTAGYNWNTLSTGNRCAGDADLDIATTRLTCWFGTRVTDPPPATSVQTTTPPTTPPTTTVATTTVAPPPTPEPTAASERVTPTPTDVPTVAPTTSPPSPMPTSASPLPELFCGSYVVDSTVGKPNLVGNSAGDIVYRWHFPAGGAYTIDTCTTTTRYDSYLRLYADEALTTQLQFNDDGCSNPGVASILSGSRAAGVYYIVVDGFSSNEGTFGLSVTCTPPTTTVATTTVAPSPTPEPTAVDTHTCSGTISCQHDTIACAPGMNCRVDCTGSGACRQAKIIVPPAPYELDLQCTTSYSCHYIRVENFLGRATCSGSYGCFGARMPNAAGSIACAGAFGCGNATVTADPAGSLDIACTGMASCKGLELVGPMAELDCAPSHSCQDAHIQDVDQLYCRGSYSCAAANVADVPDIDCLGSYSCAGANVRDVPDIDCVGNYSCRNSNLQNIDDIHCSGNYSCQSAEAYGGAHFNAVCDGSSTCVGAHFEATGGMDLSCGGSFGCANGTFVNVTDVNCANNGTYACRNARFDCVPTLADRTDTCSLACSGIGGCDDLEFNCPIDGGCELTCNNECDAFTECTTHGGAFRVDSAEFCADEYPTGTCAYPQFYCGATTSCVAAPEDCAQIREVDEVDLDENGAPSLSSVLSFSFACCLISGVLQFLRLFE